MNGMLMDEKKYQRDEHVSALTRITTDILNIQELGWTYLKLGKCRL